MWANAEVCAAVVNGAAAGQPEKVLAMAQQILARMGRSLQRWNGWQESPWNRYRQITRDDAITQE
eukprot:325966-Prymnesium_polylepis.1